MFKFHTATGKHYNKLDVQGLLKGDAHFNFIVMTVFHASYTVVANVNTGPNSCSSLD